MPESGKNFIFRLLLAEPIEQKNINEIIYIDLNNINKDADIIFELKRQAKTEFVKVQDTDKFLLELCAQGPLIIVVNFGDNREINSNMISKLLQFRTRYGTDFTYVILGYTNVFNMVVDLNLKELLVKQVIPILPVNDIDLNKLIQLNSKQFNCKVSDIQREKISILSGGNPGIIKTLVQQISENRNWMDPDMDDQRLIARLDRLSAGLTVKQLSDIKLIKVKSQSDGFLLRFGYVIKRKDSTKKIFSDLYREFLLENAVDNESNIIFTKQEKKVLQLLQSMPGEIVDRTSISKIIWGKQYLDRYSDYAIDKHISNIRKKCKSSKEAFLIKTVKGRGYYLLNQ